MRELRFEGLSQDGTRVLLAGKDGQKWSLHIDDRLVAAIRQDRARISQIELQQAGALRPREIQARIRAGATAEDVAAASGLPVAHIRRFEGPVLSERAWVAHQAQGTEVRRPAGDIPLSQLVAERLAEHGIEPESIGWDAWRRDDGLWVVIATFPFGPNTLVATWTYDTTGRTMTVADDNARQLSSISSDSPVRLAPARPGLSAVADDDAPDARVIDLSRGERHAGLSDVEPFDVRDPFDDATFDEAGFDGAVLEDAPADQAGAVDEAERFEQPQPTSHAQPTAGPAGDASADPDHQVVATERARRAAPDRVGSPDRIAAPVGRAQPASVEESAVAASAAPDEEADDEPEEQVAESPSGMPSGLAALFEAPNPPRRSSKPAVPSFDDILFGPGPR